MENERMPEYLIRYKLNPSKQHDDPKVAYEAMKVAMASADELMEAGIFKHHWSTSPASGVVIAKFPSFEEAYKLGNRFWPMISMEIQEVISWDKVKEIALPQAKEAAEQ
jgi:urease accessory protein UreE